MSKEDEEILNNFINKKDELLDFKEIKAIVKLLLEIHKKIKEGEENKWKYQRFLVKTDMNTYL